MLVIDKPEIKRRGKETVVFAEYAINNDRNHLWFSVSEEYEKYLVTENADAFVIGLLLLAMKNGEDIQVNASMSRKLYYSLTHYVIPALNLANPEWKPIEIVVSGQLTSRDLNEAGTAGTGVSCGIDSFCTIVDHLDCEREFEIKYFTFFNAGSHGEFGGDFARKVFLDRLELVRPFAEEANIPIIAVDSNINEILLMNHRQTHTVRDVACVLNLQKLFRNYYYASAYRFDHFMLNQHDTADYDLLLLSMLSTESTTFFSSASQYTRVERTEKVSNYPPSYRYLNVCTSSSRTGQVENCSVCAKCLRTQFTLDLLGRLHLYNDVFDNAKYTKNKYKAVARALCYRKTDPYSREIMDLMKATNFKIPFASRMYCFGLMARDILKTIIKQFM